MWNYFTDPVLRAPTLGCMLMCLSASLMGVIVFLKKRSLVGESISHASYPGIVIGLGIAIALGIDGEITAFFFAILFSVFGLYAIDWLEKRGRVKPDAALCFMLSSFFGLGILAVSFLQGLYPIAVKQAQMYLYGQAATMTDFHIMIYGILALLVTLFLTFAYRPLQAALFDRDFTLATALSSKILPFVISLFLLLVIVIGIRSVGVVLISGMLIAPAVAARQFTHKLSWMFILSGLFGTLSGFFGNLLALEFSLPTGPMIVLSGTFFALFALLFAPERGVVARLFRIFSFRQRSVEENILKAIWKKEEVSLQDLRAMHHLSFPFLALLLSRMKRQGWLMASKEKCALTIDGRKRAARIVRLHRLWEAYLSHLGWPEEKVHRTAEEMEHILTPDLEEKLAVWLSHPKMDPHAQPIPEKL
jgi:manganese/zinc/iron transport system permease protein